MKFSLMSYRILALIRCPGKMIVFAFIFYSWLLVDCGSVMLITISYVCGGKYHDRLLLRQVNVLVKKEVDPLMSASNVYKCLNENDKVRVLEVVFKPGDVAKMHHHPDHVVYALKGGKASLMTGGKTEEMDIKTGSVLFLDAQDHEVTNIGKTTIDLIVMELKK